MILSGRFYYVKQSTKIPWQAALEETLIWTPCNLGGGGGTWNMWAKKMTSSNTVTFDGKYRYRPLKYPTRKYAYSSCCFGDRCPRLQLLYVTHVLQKSTGHGRTKVTPLTCIWESHSSNLSQHIISSAAVRDLPSPSRHMPGQDPQLCHDHFLPHPFS
jgi:hypothetical protein